MYNEIYTMEEMKKLGIATEHYTMVTMPEIVLAVLEMKAECKKKDQLRAFFCFLDGRKIITPVFEWQDYAGVKELPNGSLVLLTYSFGKDGKCFLKKSYFLLF